MNRIVWTIEARTDLHGALDWLRKRNRPAAIRAELDILEAVAAAARRPKAGRSYLDSDVRLRSLPKWHRRIAYQVVPEGIIVLSIKDPRQGLGI